LGGVVIAIQQPAAVLIYTKRSQACNALWRYGEGFLFFLFGAQRGGSWCSAIRATTFKKCLEAATTSDDDDGVK